MRRAGQRRHHYAKLECYLSGIVHCTFAAIQRRPVGQSWTAVCQCRAVMMQGIMSVWNGGQGSERFSCWPKPPWDSAQGELTEIPIGISHTLRRHWLKPIETIARGETDRTKLLHQHSAIAPLILPILPVIVAGYCLRMVVRSVGG